MPCPTFWESHALHLTPTSPLRPATPASTCPPPGCPLPACQGSPLQFSAAASHPPSAPVPPDPTPLVPDQRAASSGTRTSLPPTTPTPAPPSHTSLVVDQHAASSDIRTPPPPTTPLPGCHASPRHPPPATAHQEPSSYHQLLTSATASATTLLPGPRAESPDSPCRQLLRELGGGARPGGAHLGRGDECWFASAGGAEAERAFRANQVGLPYKG